MTSFFSFIHDLFINEPCLKTGSSMNFLGLEYYRNSGVKCNIGDKVIIHPVKGRSQAKKPYPAMISKELVKGRDGKVEGMFWVLVVVGIEDNKEWKGAWINDYVFSRLEFVSRNYIV